jgi:excisionase family DNA binding protein
MDTAVFDPRLTESARAADRPTTNRADGGRAALDELHQLKEQCQAFDALVNGERLLDRIIDILVPVLNLPEPTYGIAEAAKLLGYSAEHLRRLIRDGQIPNRGGDHLRVRLSECPQRRRATPPVRSLRRRAA